MQPNRHQRTSPNFGVLAKKQAHIKNIEVWRNLTGRTQFSLEEEYWTLIYRPEESTEFEDVWDSGLMRSPRQFHGVNDNSDIVAAFRLAHPETSICEPADWITAIRTMPPCLQGGLIYLDTQDAVDVIRPRASSLLGITLSACGPRTLVCANFCLEDVYHRRDWD